MTKLLVLFMMPTSAVPAFFILSSSFLYPPLCPYDSFPLTLPRASNSPLPMPSFLLLFLLFISPSSYLSLPLSLLRSLLAFRSSLPLSFLHLPILFSLPATLSTILHPFLPLLSLFFLFFPAFLHPLLLSSCHTLYYSTSLPSTDLVPPTSSATATPRCL